jgi:5-methylcytosine-specific restriction endonuclease McrA
MALSEEYLRYIHSPEWKKLRSQIIKRDGKKCRHCGVNTKLQVHHLTYKRFGHEEPSDLITLCKDCHRIEHDLPPEIRSIKKTLKPKPKSPFNKETREILKRLINRANI